MIITGGTLAKELTPGENVGVRKNDLNKIGTKLIFSRTLLIVIKIRKESINQNFCVVSFSFLLSTKYMFSKNYIVSKNSAET